jgi:inosine/xanthosine triphosphatase
MIIAVGSKNPVKINAVREALEILNLKYDIIAVEVDSGVGPQPFCDETYVGARNRAINAMRNTNADISIGIEGGICYVYNRFIANAVVYVITKEGIENFAISASFTLPKSIVSLVLQGKELGEASDIVFNVDNSKMREGAIGLLTRVIDRKKLYVQPIIMALYPVYNKVI